MTASRKAEEAIKRAAENQRIQRQVASTGRMPDAPLEEDVETPDTDREPQ